MRPIVVVSIASSVLFGLIHGSWHHIFIQGISGFILCIFFIIEVDTEGESNLFIGFVRGIFVTTIAHSITNLVIALLTITKVIS